MLHLNDHSDFVSRPADAPNGPLATFKRGGKPFSPDSDANLIGRRLANLSKVLP